MWSKQVCILARYEPNAEQPWNEKSSEDDLERTKLTTGEIIMIDDRFYVLTCFHGVVFSSNIVIIGWTNEGDRVVTEPLAHRVDAPELDLSLIEMKPDFECDDPLTIDDFLLDHTTMFTIDRKIVSKSMESNETHRANLLYISDEMEVATSPSQPRLPYIHVMPETLDKTWRWGLSGTLVRSRKGSVAGMVKSCDRYNSSTIILIPSITLVRFVTEVNYKDSYHGLNFLPLDFQLVQCILDKEEVPFLMCKGDYKWIHSGLMFHEIAGKKITDDGRIQYHGWKLTIDAYIALTKLNSTMKLTVYDPDKDTVTTDNIGLCNVYNSIKIPPSERIEYCWIQNHAFVQLSDTLLHQWRERGDNYINSLTTDYVKRPYSINRTRRVIAIVASKNSRVQKLIDSMRKHSTPELLVIKSVDGKLVRDIDKLTKNRHWTNLELGKSNSRKAEYRIIRSGECVSIV